MVYRLTEDVAAVAGLLLAQVIPRLIVLSLDPLVNNWASKRLLLAATLLQVPLVGSLLLISTRQDLWWAAGVVAALAALGALADSTRATLLPVLVPRPQLRIANALTGRAEQGSVVLGAVATGLTIAAWDASVAFGLAAVFLAGSLGLLVGVRGWHQPAIGSPAAVSAPVQQSWIRVRRHSILRLLATGLFAAAVLGMSLRVALVEVVMRHVEPSGAVYALLLSAVGLGALTGPIPIPRLVGRVGVTSVVAGIVVILALNVAIVGLTGSLALIALVLFINGLLGITNDLATATVTRRLVPESQLDGVFRLMMGGVLSGQIVALLVILGLTRVWSLADVMLVTASCCAIMAIVLFLMSDRSNS